MAITTNQELKQEILDNIAQFRDNPHAEDLLHEFADSVTPIYYSDIIKEWSELESAYCESWQEFVSDPAKHTITSLMQMDLYNYYLTALTTVWDEIKEELEESESN
jgi:hypothetical protein